MAYAKLLVYKLCYCMGIPRPVLTEMFPEVQKAVDRVQFFSGAQKASQFRVIYRTYYRLIRYYKPEATLAAATECVKGVTLSRPGQKAISIPEFMAYLGSTGATLAALAEMGNSLLDDVNKELHVGLPPWAMKEALGMKALSEQEILPVQYFLLKQKPEFNVYFAFSPVMNLTPTELLRSDSAFLRRLRLLNGNEPIAIEKDTTRLNDLVNAERTARFKRVADLDECLKIYVDLSTVSENVCAELKAGDIAFTEFPTIEECCLHCKGEEVSSEKCTVFTQQVEFMQRSFTQEEMPMILVPIPIARGNFKRINRGDVFNTYLYASPKAEIPE